MTRWGVGGIAALIVGGLVTGTWLAGPVYVEQPLASPYGLGKSDVSRIGRYFGDAAAHQDYEVSVVALHRWLTRGTPVFLIDVRQPGGQRGFNRGHIAGAHNIPLQWMGQELKTTRPRTVMEPFEGNQGTYHAPVAFIPLPPHERIVVMCYDGNGGEMTPVLLRLLGYRAYGLRDGVSLWNGALNVWPRWKSQPAKINWPLKTGVGVTHEAAPRVGHDVLDPSWKAALASFFQRAHHPYRAGYTYPWTITAPALAAALTGPHPPQVIDVRMPNAYRTGHIAGSINIPFSDLGSNLSRLNPNRSVVLVSQSLQEAAQATAILRLLGYHADVLKQGLADWNHTADRIARPQHYPIVH